MPLLLSFLVSWLFTTGSPGPEMLAGSWPATGPPRQFLVTGLGNGYSSPVPKDDTLFVTGEIDSIGYLFAYDAGGKLLWKVAYGREWTIQFPGPRADPVVSEGYIYLVTAPGEVLCLQSADGSKVWSVDMVRDLGGVTPTFGYSVPALISGKMLFCIPGGEKNNLAALDRFTGKVLWSSAGKGETSGYGSPLLIRKTERDLLVTSTEYNILGLDAANGELLWSYELTFKGEVPCNTPLYDNGKIFWIAGPGNGAVAANLSADGKTIGILWKNRSFDTFFGDFLLEGNNLIGASDRMRKYISVDTASGEITDSLSFGTGSVIRAGGMLIAYNQKGEVGLIRLENGKISLVSSFRIDKGTREHFSHPVYRNGILYIRHGDVLLAYRLDKHE
jgi:outer membrane protein assembly factor BamB